MHSYVTPADDAPRGSGRFGEKVGRGLSGWSILGRIFGHLCTALVYRGAFFRRHFGAVFERAKFRLKRRVRMSRARRCESMSHWRRVPRAGFKCAI